LIRCIEFLIDLRIIERVAQGVSVALQGVLARDTSRFCLVLGLVLLSFSKHTLDLFLGQTALVIRNDNLVGFARALLNSGDVHNTIGVNVKRNLDLGHTSGSRRYASELEFPEEIVVLRPCPLALKNLNEHTGLVIREG